MGLTEDIITVSIGLTAIVATVLHRPIMSALSKENFASGFGYNKPPASSPLYINFYKENLSSDFNLMDAIQRLKYQVFQKPPRTVATDAGTGEVGLGPTLNPIILFPDLGCSRIEATWNKPTTPNLRSVDPYNRQFDQPEKWSCRQVQDYWVNLWFPKEQNATSNNAAQYCWQDNVRVKYDHNTNTIQNSEGVRTIVPNFGRCDFLPGTYMDTIYEALQALGYKKGTTLFGAPYDFRKICSKDILDEYQLELAKLIERSVKINGKKAVLIGHGLGSVLANYFLVQGDPEWKNKYIESFVTMNGSFGGAPKALRTELSGSDTGSGYQAKTVLREGMSNFAGTLLMLPSPSVYGDLPLIHQNDVSYTSKDIPYLLNKAGYYEASEIHKNIIFEIQQASLQAPHVPVFALCGKNVMTESSFMYKHDLTENPVKNYPYYQMDLPYGNNFEYPREFNGDGTMPLFALELPLTWTKSQKEPINYRFYENAEHLKILSMNEPVKDLIRILTSN